MRVIIGVLLLAAAGLKLYGLSVSAVPRVGWFAQPGVQLLAVEWELVLGAWLLSGLHPRLSWLAALVTFIGFAAVSGYLGWVGVASCGCFGTIRANPWWAFGADAAAIATLLACRPQAVVGGPEGGRLRGGLMWVGGVALLVAGVVGAGIWFSGSPAAAFARLRGEPLSVSGSYIDLGAGAVGDTRESSVQVWNWSDRPVRLIGGTTDCSCVTTSDLPLTIPPGESRVVSVRLTIPQANPGAFTRTAVLWTDHDRHPTIRLRIGCRVVE